MIYALKQIAGWIILAVVFTASSAAYAGPEGSYRVAGENPDGAGQYRGTVVVAAQGDAYSVEWRIDNSRFTGVGVLTDTIFSVAYYGSNLTGVAVYRELVGGTWNGVWTVRGSTRLGKEVWTRQ